jgi:hypothetical protein
MTLNIDKLIGKKVTFGTANFNRDGVIYGGYIQTPAVCQTDRHAILMLVIVADDTGDVCEYESIFCQILRPNT